MDGPQGLVGKNQLETFPFLWVGIYLGFIHLQPFMV
jgi:hypothetical protein